MTLAPTSRISGDRMRAVAVRMSKKRIIPD